MQLVYKNEPKLFVIAAVISAIVWAVILVVSKGSILLLIPFMFLGYVFGHSGFIAHFKGRGALVSPAQFPDLDEKVAVAVQLLKMAKRPETYLVNANGVFNAFATKFLRRYYVVLNSSIVDALRDDPDGISFYIGHELGHIRRKHLLWHTVLLPGLMLPLLGAAYMRACEYSCDMHGAACCKNPTSAARALAVLAVGSHRWKDMNMNSYVAQTLETGGFWMSFHELVASYPWLTKRLTRMIPDFPGQPPVRNPFAYMLAAFVPRLSLASLVFIYCVYIYLALPPMMKAMSNLNAAGHPAVTAPADQDFEDK